MNKRLPPDRSRSERAVSSPPSSLIRGDQPGGPPWPKEPVPPAGES